MIAHAESFPAQPWRLRDIALATIAEACPDTIRASTDSEVQLLNQIAAAIQRNERSLQQAIDETVRRPRGDDICLVWLAQELRLSRTELLAVALAAAVEDDALVGRVVAHVQAPVGGSRPTLGLLAHAIPKATNASGPVLPALLHGPAAASGLLAILNDTAPLPERPVAVPTALCLALSGHESGWPGTAVGLDASARVPLPSSLIDEARQHAAALQQGTHRALVLRTRSAAEGRSVALEIAGAMGAAAAFVETDKVAGLGAWLLLRQLVPVFCVDLAPGERRHLPRLHAYDGPILVVCGLDGSIETSHGTPASWHIPIPCRAGRRELWLEAFGASPGETARLADEMSSTHRHGAGRIFHLGRLARHHAAVDGRTLPEAKDVFAASWTGEAGGLDALAEPLRAPVPDAALVVRPSVRDNLDTLLRRCRMRENLVAGLGASASTRYQPGVRALFTGPSGTGKTLAAGWIATALTLPLYRVDLASVTSKYIGETEKNLSQLLARAEQAEVILLFDEADSLFGKRTEINDANDRFANAQTNFLLQRIESYDGIVLLTSNSQARFDEAFTRRLDFIIDFPAPGPDERRALWLSHLGPQTAVTPAQLNQLAVLVDFTGGNTRNAVLAAAVRAREARRQIEFSDVIEGVDVELRKLGRQMPVDLRAAR